LLDPRNEKKCQQAFPPQMPVKDGNKVLVQTVNVKKDYLLSKPVYFRNRYNRYKNLSHGYSYKRIWVMELVL